MSATISDVAKLAQVSKKTVSRVINNEGNVADNTRDRVLQAIEQLGYSPNPWAQSLARGKSGSIALMFDDAASSYVTSVMNGLMDAAETINYNISVIRCDPDNIENVQFALQLASHSQADGLVITPPCDSSKELLSGLDEINFPFVLLTPHERNQSYAWVVASDEKGSYDATTHLINLGHTRIAYIQGNLRHQASWNRLEGYIKAMREAGAPILDGYMMKGDSWSYEAGVRCTRDLLQMEPRPTAIVTGGDEIAAGAIQTALSAGLKLPDELSIIGFDDSPIAQQLWPQLTTVRQPIRDIAMTALHILVDGFIQQEDVMTQVVVPTELIVRQSTMRHQTS